MSDKHSEASSDESDGSVLKVLLPYLIGTAFAAAFLVLVVLKLTGLGGGSSGMPKAVVFDVIKLSNSQRAVAATLIKPESQDAAENATLLLDVSKRTRESIRKIAGDNTLVLVKQGVVSPELPDITDEVLKDLGLPVVVPTKDTMGYLTEIAPSYLSMLPQITPAPRRSDSGPSSGSILP